MATAIPRHRLAGWITLCVGLVASGLAAWAHDTCFGGRPCHFEEQALYFGHLALFAIGLALSVSIGMGAEGKGKKLGRIALVVLVVFGCQVVLGLIGFSLYPPLV